VYPRLLTICRVGQLGSLGPLPDYRRTGEKENWSKDFLLGNRLGNRQRV
jgi:hypothetical protein